MLKSSHTLWTPELCQCEFLLIFQANTRNKLEKLKGQTLLVQTSWQRAGRWTKSVSSWTIPAGCSIMSSFISLHRFSCIPLFHFVSYHIVSLVSHGTTLYQVFSSNLFCLLHILSNHMRNRNI